MKEVDYTCAEVRAAHIWLLGKSTVSQDLLKKQVAKITDEFILHETNTSESFRIKTQELVNRYRLSLPKMQ